jgi:hypothetical protein
MRYTLQEPSLIRQEFVFLRARHRSQYSLDGANLSPDLCFVTRPSRHHLGRETRMLVNPLLS